MPKMSREKRKFSPGFKAQVAMEASKGLDTVHTIYTLYRLPRPHSDVLVAVYP